MKGNARVISDLNIYLQIELTGHKQYMLASGVCANWGYRRLHERQEAYSREETEHAAKITRRILFLGGEPNVKDARDVKMTPSIQDQLEQDRGLVADAIEHLESAVEHCVSCGDGGSRALFEEMLIDEEEHIDWLEAQLTLIEQVGVAHYLQEQIHE
jgi:bacterioferritin